MTDEQAWLEADAADRRAALHEAAMIVAARDSSGYRIGKDDRFGREDRPDWIHLARDGYRFLRSRDSLRAVSVQIIPGIPHLEGTEPMTPYVLDDTDEVTFTLTGLDAKGAQVPLPDGYTAAWSLADPDASGATLTVSDDTTSAVLSGGVPDTNLMISTVVTNPDSSVINGAEAVVVQQTAAVTVGLVAGTPEPEGS